MIAVIILHSLSRILGEAVWLSCQYVGWQASGPQTVPCSSPTLSHVCITADVPRTVGRKKRVDEILASLVCNFLLMSLYLDYLSLFLRRDIYWSFINSESRRACDGL